MDKKTRHSYRGFVTHIISYPSTSHDLAIYEIFIFKDGENERVAHFRDAFEKKSDLNALETAIEKGKKKAEEKIDEIIGEAPVK